MWGGKAELMNLARSRDNIEARGLMASGYSGKPSYQYLMRNRRRRRLLQSVFVQSAWERTGEPPVATWRGYFFDFSAAAFSATRYGTGWVPSALSTVPPAVKMWVAQLSSPYFSIAAPPSPPPT